MFEQNCKNHDCECNRILDWYDNSRFKQRIQFCNDSEKYRNCDKKDNTEVWNHGYKRDSVFFKYVGEDCL